MSTPDNLKAMGFFGRSLKSNNSMASPKSVTIDEGRDDDESTIDPQPISPTLSIKKKRSYRNAIRLKRGSSSTKHSTAQQEQQQPEEEQQQQQPAAED